MCYPGFAGEKSLARIGDGFATSQGVGGANYVSYNRSADPFK